MEISMEGVMKGEVCCLGWWIFNSTISLPPLPQPLHLKLVCWEEFPNFLPLHSRARARERERERKREWVRENLEQDVEWKLIAILSRDHLITRAAIRLREGRQGWRRTTKGERSCFLHETLPIKIETNRTELEGVSRDRVLLQDGTRRDEEHPDSGNLKCGTYNNKQ